MNGWLALIIVVGGGILLKVLQQKGILPEQEGNQNFTTAKPKVYKVRLVNGGSRIISVIQAYREVTNAGLAEAKAAIDGAPCILLETEDAERAKRMANALRAAGATVEEIEE